MIEILPCCARVVLFREIALLLSCGARQDDSGFEAGPVIHADHDARFENR